MSKLKDIYKWLVHEKSIFSQFPEQKLEKIKLFSKSKEDENKLLQTSIAQLTQRIDFLTDNYASKISRLESVVRQLTTSLEGEFLYFRV